MDIKEISRYVELIFLAIAWFSVMCCLIRTDYNFPFALFCYYLWISRDDKANSMMLMILNGVLFFVDLIWLLSVGSIWLSDQRENPVWGQLHLLHCFAIILSVVNLLLKGAVFYLINDHRGKQQPIGNMASDNLYANKSTI